MLQHKAGTMGVIIEMCMKYPGVGLELPWLIYEGAFWSDVTVNTK
jgi:hypothetical protein